MERLFQVVLCGKIAIWGKIVVRTSGVKCFHQVLRMNLGVASHPLCQEELLFQYSGRHRHGSEFKLKMLLHWW